MKGNKILSLFFIGLGIFLVTRSSQNPGEVEGGELPPKIPPIFSPQ